MDSKIAWWVAGIPYITPEEKSIESFKRVYIIPPSKDRKKTIPFIKEKIISQLEECNNQKLQTYFITYENNEIDNDLGRFLSRTKINGIGVGVEGAFQDTQEYYDAIHRKIKEEIIPKRVAVEDIFSEDGGITAPPLYQKKYESKEKGGYRSVAETNYGQLNNVYIEYKKLVDRLDLVLRYYRSNESTQTEMFTFGLGYVCTFAYSIFSFLKSEFILLSKTVVSAVGSFALFIIKCLHFVVGAFELILSGGDIRSYISDFFLPKDKSVSGFMSALGKNISNLSSFMMTCLNDMAFFIIAGSYIFDIDSSNTDELRSDMPLGHSKYDIRYILSTLGDVYSVIGGSAKIIGSTMISIPSTISGIARDTWRGVKFAGMYVTSGAVSAFSWCWKKVKSKLDPTKCWSAVQSFDNFVDGLEKMVNQKYEKVADDLQQSLESCRSRFEAITCILKAPVVLTTIASLLGALLGFAPIVSMIGPLVGIFAGFGGLSLAIALPCSIPLLMWFLDCLLKMWGTVCNFFFYKSCVASKCKDKTSESPEDIISDTERKACMQKCWDSGVTGISSISIPFHIIKEISVILVKAHFPYVPVVVESLRLLDTLTQGKWREYFLGKFKKYAYDPGARKVRKLILENSGNESLNNIIVKMWGKEQSSITTTVTQKFTPLSKVEAEDVLQKLEKGQLIPTPENIELVRRLEATVADHPPELPVTDMDILTGADWATLYKMYKDNNPAATFDKFYGVVYKDYKTIQDMIKVNNFMKEAGEELSPDAKAWNPGIVLYEETNYALNFSERLDRLKDILEKVKGEQDPIEQKRILKDFMKNDFVKACSPIILRIRDSVHANNLVKIERECGGVKEYLCSTETIKEKKILEEKMKEIEPFILNHIDTEKYKNMVNLYDAIAKDIITSLPIIKNPESYSKQPSQTIVTPVSISQSSEDIIQKFKTVGIEKTPENLRLLKEAEQDIIDTYEPPPFPLTDLYLAQTPVFTLFQIYRQSNPSTTFSQFYEKLGELHSNMRTIASIENFKKIMGDQSTPNNIDKIINQDILENPSHTLDILRSTLSSIYEVKDSIEKIENGTADDTDREKVKDMLLSNESYSWQYLDQTKDNIKEEYKEKLDKCEGGTFLNLLLSCSRDDREKMQKLNKDMDEMVKIEQYNGIVGSRKNIIDFVEKGILPNPHPQPVEYTPLSSSQTYNMNIIADLDKASVVGDGTFKSLILNAQLTRDENGKYSVSLGDTVDLISSSGVGGRGMELSEVVEFDGKKLAADDKTGYLYDITDPKDVKPWVQLIEGDGTTTAGQKSEWMTVKDGKLYVGSHGKTMPVKGGGFENSQQWVKVVDKDGNIENVDWSDRFNLVNAALSLPKEGYVVHEAVEWLDDEKKWMIMPRKISNIGYETTNDETLSGTNKYIIADEDFSNIEIKETNADLFKDRGTASFEKIPDSDDVAVIKTYEHGQTQKTYLEVVDIKTGEQKLAPVLISNDKKFEGVLIENP